MNFLTNLRTQSASCLRGLLLGLVLFSACCVAYADNMQLANARLESAEDAWYLNADFDFELNPQLEEAINKGMTLIFVVEFELKRPRWYWLDETVATVTQTMRVSYQPLTRQYRLSYGGLQQRFNSLQEVVMLLRHVRQLKIVERNAVNPDKMYQAALRMRLDVSQLPKPFQAHAINSRDWNLGSEWITFGFNPALAATSVTGVLHEEK